MRLHDLPILVLLGTIAAVAQDAALPLTAVPEPNTAATAAESTPPVLDAPSEIGRPVPGTTNAAVLLKPTTLSVGPGAMSGPGEARWVDFENRRYGGLVGEAFATSEPWQFLNPFAPVSYGDGTRYLRQDPYTGRAEGVILFSIRLPGGNSGKSLAENRARKAAKSQPARPPAPAAAPGTEINPAE